MTVTETELLEADVEDDDDGLVHVVCRYCNPDKALCGQDVKNDAWVEDVWFVRPEDCVVCNELEKQACPGCGAE